MFGEIKVTFYNTSGKFSERYHDKNKNKNNNNNNNKEQKTQIRILNFGAVQKGENPVDLENAENEYLDQLLIWLQKLASIQPRKDLPKFGSSI